MVKTVCKSYLLKYGFFEDNEWLDKYCDLIEDNEHTKFETYRCQSHHVIPVHVFKKIGIEPANGSINLVNLLYRDHILAHYYLWKCAKDIEIKHANELAIQCLVNSNSWLENPDSLPIVLNDLQESYEQKMRGISEIRKRLFDDEKVGIINE